MTVAKNFITYSVRAVWRQYKYTEKLGHIEPSFKSSSLVSFECQRKALVTGFPDLPAFEVLNSLMKV